MKVGLSAHTTVTFTCSPVPYYYIPVNNAQTGVFSQGYKNVIFVSSLLQVARGDVKNTVAPSDKTEKGCLRPAEHFDDYVLMIYKAKKFLNKNNN